MAGCCRCPVQVSSSSSKAMQWLLLQAACIISAHDYSCEVHASAHDSFRQAHGYVQLA